ncbi:MAG: hypothetical protein ACK6DC_07765 [Planctomycetota bacterium]
MAPHRHYSSETSLAFLLAAIFLPAVAIGQDVDRYVKPPTPSRTLDETSPRDAKGLGGFFMPLKSFSNPFSSKGRTSEDSSDAQPGRSEKPYREPFAGTDRTQRTNPEFAPPSDQQADLKNLPAVESNPRPQPSAAKSKEPITFIPGKDPTAGLDPAAQNEANKSYAANPKSENLDPIGTSRRSKSSAPLKRSSKTPKEDAAKTSEKTTESNDSTEPKPISDSKASPKPQTETPIVTSSAKPVTKKQDSVRAQLANNNSTAPGAKNSPESKVRLNLHTPGVSINMIGPDSILVGKSVPYVLIAANESNEPVRGLAVRIVVPANVAIEESSASDGVTQSISEDHGSGVVWELKELPAKTKQSLKIAVRTEKPEHFAARLDWKIENPTVLVPLRVQQPQLILALEGASEANLGKPQTYRLRVRNPGNATAEGIRIGLQADHEASHEEVLGDLPPGTERIVEVELTFERAGKTSIVANAVSVGSNLEVSRSIDVDVRQSQLHAAWEGPADFYQGNTADYTLTLENRGGIDALGNKCRVTLPIGAELAKLPKGISRTKNQLHWELPRLAIGEKIDWNFQVVMNGPGENLFTFEADSSTGEGTQATLQTRVDAVADLALSVNDPISPAPIGKPVVYEMIITNRGKKTAEDVFVIAQFSDGIEPTRVDGHAGKLVPGQVLFDPIPKIEPGEQRTLTITAEASKSGNHRFRASVRCQGSEDDLLKEESTRFTAAGNAATISK